MILFSPRRPLERMWVTRNAERFEAQELESGWRWRFRPSWGWRALRPVDWKQGSEQEMWTEYHDWVRP